MLCRIEDVGILAVRVDEESIRVVMELVENDFGAGTEEAADYKNTWCGLGKP